MKTKNIYWSVALCTALTASLAFRSVNITAISNGCTMSVTYSEMAYGQFKKAYKAKSMDEAKNALKKGMDQAKQAAAYAGQCNCSPAETYSLSAYTITKKIYDKEIDLDEVKPDIKKAMDLSLDAVSAAQTCNK